MLSVAGAMSVVMSTRVNANGPDMEVSDVSVAVTVGSEPERHVVWETHGGAVKAAVAGVVGGVTGVSVPHEFDAPLQLRLQVTAVFVEFDTVAVSVSGWPG
jgi:hypothetical protein